MLSQAGLPAADAAVYRWTDEQGRVQYGDRPPLDTNTDEIKIKSTPTSRSDATNSSPSELERKELRQKMLDNYQQEREEKRQARKKREQEAARQKMRCVEAKDRLRDYEDSTALYDLQPDGKRVFLTKEQFQAEMAAARAAVKKLCGAGH
ncbi:DUF4124 domain-containing protein [Sedimenticola selenatireducens]|nr:DUF4124 domain-containing protein [Sedimenticola selenatireducens]